MRIHLVILAAFLAVVLLAEPAAAGPVIGFIAGAAAKIAAANVVVGALIKIGVSIALSALSTALMGKPRSSGIQTDTTQEGGTLSQSFIVGRYATAGTRICPRMTFGDNNRDMFDVIQISDMPITAVSRISINGAWRDMNTGVSWDGIEFTAAGDLYAADIFTGSQTTASPRLMLKYSSGVERPWQSDMIGRNMAYAVMYHYFKKEEHTGWPEPLYEVQGIPLYDPRKDTTIGGSGAHRWNNKSTWEWTENPCVIIYNILRGIELPDGRIWGGECEQEDLPLAVWAAAMNKCDESVTLAGGGTQARYRCGFEIKVADDQPAEIIEELLKACSGQIVEIGGVYKIRAHGPGLPVYFFTDDDLLVTSGHEFDPFPGLAETFNTIHASYPEPNSMWESHDAPERTNATWVTEDDGRLLPANVSLPAVPIRQQVQRLMLAWLRDNRRWRRHTITLGHYAAGVEPLDVVAWTSARNGYTSKHFDVAQVVENAALVQQWEIREVNPEDYDWETTDELPTYTPSIIPDGPTSWPVPGWTVSATTIKDGAGRDRRAALRFQWTGSAVDADSIRVQIRVQGATAISAYTIADVEAGDVEYSRGILPEVTYEARARLRQAGPTEWTAWLAATTPELRLGPQDLPSTDYQSLLTDSGMVSGAPAAAGSAWGKFGDYDTYCTYGEQGVTFLPMLGAENAKYCVRIGAIPTAGAASGINARGEANRFEAEAGETYRIAMKVWVNTGTALMRCGVSWRDRTGAEITSAGGSTFTLTTTGQWIPVYADLVAPAGAVWGVARFWRVNSDTNSGNCYIARPRVMRRNFSDVTNDGDVSIEWNSYAAAWETFTGNAGPTSIDSITIADAEAQKIIGKGAFITYSAQIGLERTGSAGRARGVISFETGGGTVLATFAVQHRVAVSEEIQFPITITRKVTVPFELPLTFLVRATGENDAAGAGNVFRLRYRRLEVTAVRK
jgi:hypothetical protein